jgi:hypothetical protein
MLVLKFGKINPIMKNQIYGHLAALFMKWQHSGLLLWEKVCKTCINACLGENTHRYQSVIPMN